MQTAPEPARPHDPAAELEGVVERLARLVLHAQALADRTLAAAARERLLEAVARGQLALLAAVRLGTAPRERRAAERRRLPGLSVVPRARSAADHL